MGRGLFNADYIMVDNIKDFFAILKSKEEGRVG